MTTDTISPMQRFIENNGLSMLVEKTDDNPNMDDGGRFPMDHYTCKIVRTMRDRRTMTVTFSKGIGHKGKRPSLAEVLDCLASDASMVENSRDFTDFCNELGYDPDSRKAKRTYDTIIRQSFELRELLGEAQYKRLLWKIERA